MTDEPWTLLELSERAPFRHRRETLVAVPRRVGAWLEERGATDATVVLSTEPVRDSRLMRAWGFWRSHPELADILGSVRTQERLRERPDGLRWLALAEAPLASLGNLVLAAHAFARNRGCVLVPLHGRVPDALVDGIADVLSRARYEAQIVEASLDAARAAATVVIVPWGRFDDLDCGLLVGGPACRRDGEGSP